MPSLDTPVVPGLALPAAFEALDKRLESTLQLCQLKSSAESQTLGLVTVCQELQRLLKFAFIGEKGHNFSRSRLTERSLAFRLFPVGGAFHWKKLMFSQPRKWLYISS